MTGRSPQDRDRRSRLADVSLAILPAPGPDLETVRDLLAPAGECARCHEQVKRRVTIGLVQGNSGPGWSQYGCIPCARDRAARTLAPQWIRDDVARLTEAGL